jgi:hypothetical protein
MDKAKGVMTALKGRKGFGSKKGVALLAIVQKLTAKRKAAGGDTAAHENAENPMKEAAEAKAGKD